jgi:hypothetical protein
MPINPSDAEISSMLDMLAEDSSDSVPAETLVVAPIPEPGKMSHPGFRGPKPGREHNHQVCWDQVSHI